MKKINYITDERVCSKSMIVETDDYGIITNVDVIGGCQGNLMGLSALLVGMKTEEAIRMMEGINCRNRGTSCPDQLSKAMRQMMGEEKNDFLNK